MGFLAVLPPSVLAVSAVLAGCAAGPSQTPTTPPPALGAAPPGTSAWVDGRVVHVVDGDTIDVRAEGHRIRVRLLGIDTPETVRPDTPVQCFGPQASARTRYLLPTGVTVVVQTDANAGLLDDYGRVLGYVTPAGARMSVNELLLREGFARLYVFDRARPFTRVAAFRLAERRAVAARLGLWRACPTPAGAPSP